MKTLGKTSLDSAFPLVSAKFQLISHQLFSKSFTITHGASHISQTGMTLDSESDKSGLLKKKKPGVYFPKIAGGSEGSP